MVERSSIAGLPAAVAARRQLAEELRDLRAKAYLVAREVAEEVGFSVAKLSRIETAQLPVKPADLKELLRVYEADEPTAQRLLQLAATAKGNGAIPVPDIPLPAETAAGEPDRPELRAALLDHLAAVRSPGVIGAARRIAEHVQWLREVIGWHGWPGYSAVGHDGSYAAVMMLLVADSRTRAECLPLLTGAVLLGDADPYHLACVVDRHLLDTGRAQIFNTHGAQPDIARRAPVTLAPSPR
jgi:transcriptional regulator with XRE-family HTH domain